MPHPLITLLLTLLLSISTSAHAMGGLMVKCNIDGAQVRLDGKDKGTCPAKLFTTAGTHTLEISKPVDADTEYYYKTQVNLPEGEPQKLNIGLGLVYTREKSRQIELAMRQAIQRAENGAVGHVFKDCPDCPDMVVIPSGTFTMGSSAAEQALANAAGSKKEWTDWENPQHGVRLRSFAMGRYAVTKAEFAAFVQAKGYQTEAERGDGCSVWKDNKWQTDKAYNWRNVGFSQSDNHPVACVSWNDAQAYVQWLGERTGKPYRLPSESEREYATRAGSQTAFWWGDNITTHQANYGGTGDSYNGSPKGEYRQATVPVNSFSANPFGLYNVHGNVWEWVQDCFHDNYNGAPVDGSAWTTGCSNDKRVLRGGSWGY